MNTRAIAIDSVTVSAKLRDAAVLLTIFVIGTAWCWQFRQPWVVANVLLLGLPLAYLLLVSQKARTSVKPKFTALFIVLAIVGFDFMCEQFGGWSGPTVFPFKLPGGVTLEEVQWIIFYFPLTMSLNEHFFATQVKTPPNRIAKRVLKSFFYIALLAAVLCALLFEEIPFVYLWVGLILQPTFILFGIWVNRWIIREVLWIGIVTGFLNLIFEFLALRNNYWNFPGTYIGDVRMFGFEFPVEELLFLIIFSGPSIVATYAIYKNWKQI